MSLLSTGDTNFKYTVEAPLLFRYMEAKYVEAFFNDGSLRLSSFAKFGKHKDEQRLDKKEGKITFATRSQKNGGQTIIAEIAMGHDAYILSTTALHSEKLMSDFGCDSYIKIINSHQFGQAIAKAIPGVKRAFECFCFYHSTKLWFNDDMHFDFESHKLANGSYAIEPFAKYLIQGAGIKPFLIKNKEYSPQCEYRFVWIIDKNADSTILDRLKGCVLGPESLPIWMNDSAMTYLFDETDSLSLYSYEVNGKKFRMYGKQDRPNQSFSRTLVHLENKNALSVDSLMKRYPKSRIVKTGCLPSESR